MEKTQVYKAFEGTARELIQRGTKVNGRFIDTVGFSVLAKFGVIKVVGKEEKTDPHARGRIGAIYKLQGKPGFKVE